MFFLNLSLVEFLGLFSAVSAVTVALYLLDRSKKRQIVATLRFWTAATKPVEMKHRRRIQQPWSLLLQILSIALLLLAIAQLRFGSPDRTSRDNVVILETSAWMSARTPQGGTLMNDARIAARGYIRALPASDRVMLVRADALATPATGFESSRRFLEDAIADSQPTASALNLSQALAFAQQMQKLKARRAGEIVVIGSGRISEQDAATAPSKLDNLRIVPLGKEVENCGLSKIGLRRSTRNPDRWEIFVSARNYGSQPRTLPLTVTFGGAPVGTRHLTLAPGDEQSATFEYQTRAAGWLEARLLTKDAIPADDSAVLELPEERTLRVTVYSEDQSLRPLLAANPNVQAVFRPTSAYTPEPAGGIVILDRFNPGVPPQSDSIYIQPPARGAPAAIQSEAKNVQLSRWNTDHPLTAGLHAKGLRLDLATVYRPGVGDVPVAETVSGPIVLARSGKSKTVVLGFHPVHSNMRYQLATPLLFANTLRWMAPDIFRRWDLSAGRVGVVNSQLEADVDPKSVKVVADNQGELPFTVEGNQLRFFTGTPGTVRVLTGDREKVYSLTLPEVAEARWEPSSTVPRGIPRSLPDTAGSRELWQILALLGLSGLLVEWLLYGRRRQTLTAPSGARFSARAPDSSQPWYRRYLRRAS